MIENVQVVISGDQSVEQAIKEEGDSFLEEFSFILQKETLEKEMQEVSSSSFEEEDNHTEVLNKELQVITSKPKYKEQFEGVLKDIITIILFKKVLKDLMEEVQEDSLLTLFQDKRVAARGMILHQRRPPEALLDDLQGDSANETSNQDVIVEGNIAPKEFEITMENVQVTKMIGGEDQCLETLRHEVLQTMDAWDDHQEITSGNILEGKCYLEDHLDSLPPNASPFQEQANKHLPPIQEQIVLGEHSSLLQKELKEELSSTLEGRQTKLESKMNLEVVFPSKSIFEQPLEEIFDD